jgi:hypothetical protein
MEDFRQLQSNMLVRETRETIEMLNDLASKLEEYTNLLEAELDKQEPPQGGDESGQ